MQPALSLVIIDSDRNSRIVVQEILKPLANLKVIGAAANFQEGLRIAQTTAPEIIILEARELEKAVEEVRYFLSRSPQVSVFVTAEEKNPDWILRLIRAGASEYLTKPLVGAELLDAVRKVFRRQASHTVQNTRKGQVISIYNPNGGMGTTTVAVNLAATLASQGKKTVLVDLNLFNSDVTAFLDLAPRYTVATLAGRTGELDGNILRSVIASHTSGLQVLSGPKDLDDAGKVTPELLREVIGILETEYDYSIIDVGGQLSQCNLTGFSCSDMVLYNTVLSLTALRNAKRYLPAMEDAGVAPEKLKFVVNRHIPKDEIRVSDAEKVLDTRCYMTIPNVYQDARYSINKGIPITSGFPKSPITKAIADLARQVTADVAATLQGSQEIR